MNHPQATPPTTISGPITKEVVSKNYVAALQEASTMLDRAAQALKDWRAYAKALTDYRQGKISLAEARRRWAKSTRVGLAGADRFDKQAEVYKKAATTANNTTSSTRRPELAPHVGDRQPGLPSSSRWLAGPTVRSMSLQLISMVEGLPDGHPGPPTVL